MVVKAITVLRDNIHTTGRLVCCACSVVEIRSARVSACAVELYIPGLEKRTWRDVMKIMFEGRLDVFYGTKENTVRAATG